MHAWASVNDVTTITSVADPSQRRSRCTAGRAGGRDRSARGRHRRAGTTAPPGASAGRARRLRRRRATGTRAPRHRRVTRRSTVVTRCPSRRTSASIARRPAGPGARVVDARVERALFPQQLQPRIERRPGQAGRAPTRSSRTRGPTAATAAPRRQLAGPQGPAVLGQSMACTSHTVAACRSAGSTRSRSTYPAPRVGTSTSRIAASGTRTSSETRSPSGRRNACTVMSSGTSWAAVVPPRARRAAASSPW